MVKLQQMSQLVSPADDLTKREAKFIEGYPLATLLKQEAAGLLSEADVLMASLVSTHDWLKPTVRLLGVASLVVQTHSD